MCGDYIVTQYIVVRAIAMKRQHISYRKARRIFIFIGFTLVEIGANLQPLKQYTIVLGEEL